MKPMKIASFVGKKGGVGKTTNAHSAAHGLSMAGIPAAYILTDKRPLLSDAKRVYTIIDGRTVPQLERAIASARQRDSNGIFVIDGGGNRGVVDDLLASVSDLVILPFTADDDSVFVVNEEMAHFPEAWAMPSNWPTNSKAQTVDAGYIEKLEANYPGRLLPSMPATHSVRDFLLAEFNGSVLPPAQRYCRTLARQIAVLLYPEERAGTKAA
jgi:cellulose biosynthesis protein BcsQ